MTALAACGPAGRDQSCSTTPPSVDDHEESPDGVDTDRNEPIVVGIVVWDRDREVVIQGLRRIREVDAVLSEVRYGLAVVPLDFHRLTICTFVHIVKTVARASRYRTSPVSANSCL